jgi:cytochrome c oxidase cbb3-type subunit 3
VFKSMHKKSRSSLCNLCVLCVSVVKSPFNHRDTENTEVTQRNLRTGLFVLLLVFLAGCEREKRQFSAPPATFKAYDVTMSDIHPGTPGTPQPVQNPSDNHAVDTNEGKRLFVQYNCSGCHFNGGGGIGPPLMDEKWIYGDKPENIYSTIVEGRPNGMPSFRQKIPDSQLREIVAYVRSMSGQLRKDVAPTRNDDMNAHRSEERTERKRPQQTTAPFQ